MLILFTNIDQISCSEQADGEPVAREIQELLKDVCGDLPILGRRGRDLNPRPLELRSRRFFGRRIRRRVGL